MSLLYLTQTSSPCPFNCRLIVGLLLFLDFTTQPRFHSSPKIKYGDTLTSVYAVSKYWSDENISLGQEVTWPSVCLYFFHCRKTKPKCPRNGCCHLALSKSFGARVCAVETMRWSHRIKVPPKLPQTHSQAHHHTCDWVCGRPNHNTFL